MAVRIATGSLEVGITANAGEAVASREAATKVRRVSMKCP
jgi:hypothetical protein